MGRGLGMSGLDATALTEGVDQDSALHPFPRVFRIGRHFEKLVSPKKIWRQKTPNPYKRKKKSEDLKKILCKTYKERSSVTYKCGEFLYLCHLHPNHLPCFPVTCGPLLTTNGVFANS
ncbi:hypothetical protein TNCV_5115411 [Trichonephila clavipes]|nr:hypothetical protein TNCV_5115411 [Trichonephila clavipes]